MVPAPAAHDECRRLPVPLPTSGCEPTAQAHFAIAMPRYVAVFGGGLLISHVAAIINEPASRAAKARHILWFLILISLGPFASDGRLTCVPVSHILAPFVQWVRGPPGRPTVPSIVVLVTVPLHLDEHDPPAVP